MARSRSSRLLRASRTFLPIALLIFVTGGPTADAQFGFANQGAYSNSPSWLDRWFAPERPQRPIVRREYQRDRREQRDWHEQRDQRVYVPRRKFLQPRPVQQATPDKPDKPIVAPTYFVVVLGDALAQLLSQGLTEAFTDHPEVAISRKGLDSSGLVRDDYYNWPKTVHDLLASNEKINTAVILIGSNDHQPVRIGNMTYEPGSPKWIEAYSARIAEISSAFHEKHIPLIWVGLPIVKSDRLSAEFLKYNDFYREQAEKAGATYVDVWEAFENDRGQYDPFGPDVNGQTVRIRTSDGINFTKAGARKLAHFVEADIRRNINAAEPQVEPAVVTVPAEAPTEAAVTPEKPVAPVTPTAVVAPPPAPIIIKPVAGPVLPLTGPVSSPGAQLATRVNVKSSDTTRPAMGRAFADEKLLAPKPGRADNFAWPKP